MKSENVTTFEYEPPVIKSIIPADGWFAVYADRNLEGSYIMDRLVCWATLSKGDGDEVVGMVSGDTDPVYEASRASNFIGYSFGQELSVNLRGDAAAYVESLLGHE